MNFPFQVQPGTTFGGGKEEVIEVMKLGIWEMDGRFGGSIILVVVYRSLVIR